MPERKGFDGIVADIRATVRFKTHSTPPTVRINGLWRQSLEHRVKALPSTIMDAVIRDDGFFKRTRVAAELMQTGLEPASPLDCWWIRRGKTSPGGALTGNRQSSIP